VAPVSSLFIMSLTAEAAPAAYLFDEDEEERQLLVDDANAAKVTIRSPNGKRAAAVVMSSDHSRLGSVSSRGAVSDGCGSSVVTVEEYYDDAEDETVRAAAVAALGVRDSISSPSSGFVSQLSCTADTGVGECSEEAKRKAKYLDLLRRSSSEDLADVAASSCVYRAGHDKQGRKVVVFIGKWFKQSLNLEKALMYLLRTVDSAAEDNYVVVYFHTRTSRDNVPHFWWMKEVYQTLPYKYKKNLKAFYVVHPTWWSRMATWWFSTFITPAIKSKIRNIHALEELKPFVDVQTLDVPMFVTEQDMIFHGLRYYQP